MRPWIKQICGPTSSNNTNITVSARFRRSSYKKHAVGSSWQGWTFRSGTWNVTPGSAVKANWASRISQNVLTAGGGNRGKVSFHCSSAEFWNRFSVKWNFLLHVLWWLHVVTLFHETGIFLLMNLSHTPWNWNRSSDYNLWNVGNLEQWPLLAGIFL